MDSYGVIDLGIGSLSLPGLFFYLCLVAVSVGLAVKLVARTMPPSQRKVNYFTAGLSAAVIATWAVIFFGLWFYIGN
jgi:hypothetical protein